MRVNFLTKLNTWLFVIPVLFILVAYFGIGMWFYFSGAPYVLKDFHAAQLVTMLSDKKNSVELWFDVRKKALDEIAKNGTVTVNLQKIIEGQATQEGTGDVAEKDREKGKKKVGDAGADAGRRIAKYLEGFSQFRMISFLSEKGMVIWSTNSELTGREWPDKDIFRKGTGKSDVFAGKVSPASGAEGLLFSAPATIKGEGEIPVIIIAQPNPADLAASLKVEKGFYETGRVSIIDGSGRVVAAKDMTDVGTVRYNVRPSGLEGVDYREGLYYSVSTLKNEPLRLIATLDSAEAAKPLKPLLAVYLSFAFLIVAAIVLQSVFIAPRLIEKPLLRLVKATQSISDGDLRSVNLRKGYIGELQILAEGFSQMIVGVSKKWLLPGSPSGTPEMTRSKPSLTEIFAGELGSRLVEIGKGLEGARGSVMGLTGPEKDVTDAITDIKGLVMTLDDLDTLMKLRNGAIKVLKKECAVCDILKEIEDTCFGLIGGREIELIVECSQDVLSRTFSADRRLTKRLGSALLRNALRLTEVGTITLMAGSIARDGTEYIELSVSDTGRGMDTEAVRTIMKEESFSSQYLELCISRDFTGMMGGRLLIESSPGKGSLVAVAIPVGDHAPEIPQEEKIL
jgi:signal transduction histidine kinase